MLLSRREIQALSERALRSRLSRGLVGVFVLFGMVGSTLSLPCACCSEPVSQSILDVDCCENSVEQVQASQSCCAEGLAPTSGHSCSEQHDDSCDCSVGPGHSTPVTEIRMAQVRTGDEDRRLLPSIKAIQSLHVIGLADDSVHTPCTVPSALASPPLRLSLCVFRT